jgi:ribokinase
MSPEITVFGSINMDMVVYSAKEPKKGETVIGSSFETFQGGKGANQAVSISRLGVPVSFVGKVGNDVFGNELLDSLKKEAVDISGIQRSSEDSGTAFITVYEETSQNQIIVILGANALVNSDQVTEETLISSKILIAQLETPSGETEKLFKRSKEFECYCILNTAPVHNLSNSLMDESDLLIMNETELATLSGDSPSRKFTSQVLNKSLEKIPLMDRQSVIVTLGSQGVYVYENKTGTLIPGLDVMPVDTTGSGDCFVGALATQYLEHGNLVDAAYFANKAAALSVTKKGASASMPTLEEVVNLI